MTEEHEHDWAVGWHLASDVFPPVSDAFIWSKRHLVCRTCETVEENDRSDGFAIRWAQVYLRSLEDVRNGGVRT